MPNTPITNDTDRLKKLVDGAAYALQVAEDAEWLTQVERLLRPYPGGNITACPVNELPEYVAGHSELGNVGGDVGKIAARYSSVFPPTTTLYAAAISLRKHATEVRSAMFAALGVSSLDDAPFSSWDMVAPLLKQLAEERQTPR